MRRFMVFGLVAFLIFVTVTAFIVSLFVQAVTSIAGVPPPPVAFVIVGLFVVFMLGVGTRSARRIAAPVADLIDAAERVERGDYGTRVTARGPRTVRGLANAFNAMSARLERSETERRRLLADVTHELRTPLTIMRGNLEALLDGVYPADASHLEAILDETQVLSRLVDDLRTLSLAEAGALALHVEPTDVADLARDAVASFRAQADQAGVTLDVSSDASASADVDPLRTREVLTNLLSNALRYTPRGGTVRVRTATDDGRVVVSVRDSGEGIAADALPHIFDRFYKSEESRGAGLGLAIAKSLVVAQGGEIGATSEPGQGTEVRFTLPTR
jgi:signal transduction histidine kinase